MKVLVQNLTCQRGETEGMDVAAHVRAVQRHLGWGGLDFVLCHKWSSSPLPDGLQADSKALVQLGVREISTCLVSDGGHGRMHDSRRLALALLRLAVIQGRTARLKPA